jgi:ribosomal protein L7Ae-like RNA K-turn-binding protein
MKQAKSKKKVRKSRWQKLKDQIQHQNITQLKDSLISRLRTLSKDTIRSNISIGHNSSLKCLEKQNASIVCLCKDTPKNLFETIVDVCILRKVPVLVLPNASTKELATAFGLKRASCFTLHTPVIPTDLSNLNGEYDGLSELMTSMMSAPLHRHNNILPKTGIKE